MLTGEYDVDYDCYDVLPCNEQMRCGFRINDDIPLGQKKTE